MLTSLSGINKLKVLFIGDNDLISRRFNGYDYYESLLDYNIESSMLVKEKLSDSHFVHCLNYSIGNFTVSIIKNKHFFDADIVHLHLIHNTPFDINYLPLITRLKPTIITLHDPFFLGAHCIYFFGCEQWKHHCADCQYLDVPFVIKNDDTALNFATKNIAINNSNISAIVASDWMNNLVKQSPIWNNKHIYKLPFGINQNIFKPYNIHDAKIRLGIDKNSITLMFRSQDNPYKGMDIIKYALNNITCNQKITLITVGQKGLLNAYKNIFTIKEFEWVTDDIFLSQLYQAADIFLMPSIQETFGLMAVEAMGCGKMVLATKNTALEKVINHPECGIAVEHNAEIFTNELQRLLNNMDETKERGERCLEFAKNTYLNDVFFLNLVDIYKDTIERFKNRTLDSTTKDTDLILSQLKKYHIDYTLSSNEFQNQNKYLKKSPGVKNALLIFLRIIIPSKKLRKKLRNMFSSESK